MAWLDGVFRCSPLGIDDCVVWWDAVAAVVAVIAVLSTLFLGFMTLRLGQMANKAAIAAADASHAAVEIAAGETKDRIQSASDERLMLLLWIAGEISAARGTVRRLQEKLDQSGREQFKKDRSLRQHSFEAIKGLEFPNCAARADRLHAIGHPIAARLARGLALIKTMSRDLKPGAVEDAHAEKVFGLFERALPKLRKDLDVVADACSAAAKECGIKQ